jgi:hypothetical protein
MAPSAAAGGCNTAGTKGTAVVDACQFVEGAFVPGADIMSAGVEAGAYHAGDVGRLTLLLAATVQGISALVASRRITADQSEALIDDAITVFLAGASTDR